jgi:hypothetical protein
MLSFSGFPLIYITLQFKLIWEEGSIQSCRDTASSYAIDVLSSIVALMSWKPHLEGMPGEEESLLSLKVTSILSHIVLVGSSPRSHQLGGDWEMQFSHMTMKKKHAHSESLTQAHQEAFIHFSLICDIT